MPHVVPATSAALIAEETIKHLLKTVELVLLNSPTGLKPIAEDGQTSGLRLSALAAE